MSEHWDLGAMAVGGFALVALAASYLPSTFWARSGSIGLAIGLLVGVDRLRRAEARFFTGWRAYASLVPYGIVCFGVWVIAGGELV
ncbi:MAG: hypothetical protein AAGF90_22170 [Pseudomonadota bacterium]